MNTLIHADIFFFTTTIIFIVMGILASIALYYVIGILKNVRDVSDTVKESSDILAEDIKALREQVKEKGLKISSFIKLFGTITSFWRRSRKTKK